MACLGGNGLHGIAGGMAPSASYVQVITDEKYNFLVAIVTRYLKNGHQFAPMDNFYVWDKPKETARYKYSVDSLDKRKTYFLDQIQTKVKENNIEKLASELLQRRSTFQLEITDISQPMEEWRVTII